MKITIVQNKLQEEDKYRFEQEKCWEILKENKLKTNMTDDLILKNYTDCLNMSNTMIAQHTQCLKILAELVNQNVVNYNSFDQYEACKNNVGKAQVPSSENPPKESEQAGDTTDVPNYE
ncbi:UNVERIFIED_CONTAM: hypothetical protein RMT77_014395 [Armadillidium vulgare]